MQVDPAMAAVLGQLDPEPEAGLSSRFGKKLVVLEGFGAFLKI